MIINTTTEQERKIREFIVRQKRDTSDYQFFSDNCVKFVKDALKKAGIEIPDDIKSPTELLDLLE